MEGIYTACLSRNSWHNIALGYEAAKLRFSPVKVSGIPLTSENSRANFIGFVM